jgi:hypothetical protein
MSGPSGRNHIEEVVQNQGQRPQYITRPLKSHQCACSEPASQVPGSRQLQPDARSISAGKYDYHNCEQLTEQRKKAAERELELKLLMEKAEQGAAGAAVSVIAYQGDYIMVREELKVIDAAARVKNCGPPR